MLGSKIIAILASILWLKQLEDVCLLLAMGKLNLEFGLLEGVTDFLLIKQKAVETVCESYNGVVFDLVLLVDAHDMLSTSVYKDLTNEL